MESFLPSTIKHWNDLSDFKKISPTLSSFKKHLKEFFSKTPNDLINFGARRCNIIHWQLRNCSSNLYKDLFEHYAALLRHAIRRRGLIFTGNCMCDVTSKTIILQVVKMIQ